MNPSHLQLLKEAQALDLAGNAKDASVAYRAFLDREPVHADAWADYASQLLKLGKPEEALMACNTALANNPQQLAARINLGVILLRQDRPKEAEGQFRSALEVDPRRMDAQLFMAECLLTQGNLAGVRKVLDGANQPGAMGGRYAVLQSHHADLWARFSSALFGSCKYSEAEAACNTVLQLDSENILAKSNLGSVWLAQGHLEKAEGLFRQMVADHPEDEQVSLLLIACLARLADIGPAELEIARVIQLAPTSFLVHKCLTGIYFGHGLWTAYQAEIERFRKFEPKSAFLDFEQGLVDLLLGNMPRGWELYEARLQAPDELRQKIRNFTQPAWNGAAFPGKTLLLWVEQGFGDALMFVRYLPQVKALGGRVILETWPVLLDLVATCQGADELLLEGAPLPPFDLQASLISLPWLFRTDLASIPAEIPYLGVPDEVPHRQEILELVDLARECTRIGLVWAGNPSHSRDRERSLPVTSMAPLAALPGVAWFSFQQGRPESPPLPNLITLAPFLKNFSDTAYALSGMDLVITVDTAVAHLAGALGIPTFLLLSYQPDFRWLLDRDDSPWYPTLRLYRQPAYGDWESVIRKVITDLAEEA